MNAPINVKHDGKLAFSIGQSRFSTDWRNLEMEWSVLLGYLRNSRDTGETMEEYLAMDEDRQASIKDIGGFVGGHFAGTRRLKDEVACRQAVTLDLDDGVPERLWDDIMDGLQLDCAMALYSTHKHRPGHPRYRIVIPLDRRVTAEEYGAIARKVAEKIGIDYCDKTAFRPTQLMYWPSHATDCAPAFEYYDAEWLKADEILSEYEDWRDASSWPRTAAETAASVALTAGKQEDPETKAGIVGAFCRTYDVPGAIDKYLSDIYIPTASHDRYTYSKGSTSGGLVIYDGGKFAYSHHSTDPCGDGHSYNAFDLVRVHLFGTMDAEGESGGTAESFRRMTDLALKDDTVKSTIAAEEKASAVLGYEDRDPGEPPEGEGGTDGGDGSGDPPESGQQPDPMGWEKDLVRDKNAKVKPTITNAVLILSKHPALQAIEYNELTHAIEVRGKLPWPRPNKYWRETDESHLYAWVADHYDVQFPDSIFRKALQVAVDGRSFSPLRDKIDSLPKWDGTERLSTLFVDYLAAPDTPYTRAVTRASMVGSIMRALEPGCVHQTVLVLDGTPGIGKSTMLAKLGGEFFADSLKLTDMKDKSAAEKMQGVWIMEIGEMQGGRRADIECVKSFISCQVDRYRPSYGKVVEQFPRSTVIWGTTNCTDGFLHDLTGNRRFWPVKTPRKGRKSIWVDLTADEVDQIWAEALAAYKAGEKNYLDEEMEIEAMKAQQEAMVADDREGLVIDYLETKIPDDFYTWTTFKRADYFLDKKRYEKEHKAATKARQFVSPVEVWVECFGKPLNQYDRKYSYEIAAIMARIPGWSKTGERRRIEEYGMQRVYTRS